MGLFDALSGIGQNNDENLDKIAQMGNPGATQEDVDKLKYAMQMGASTGSIKPNGVAQDLYNLSILQKARAGNPLTQITSHIATPQSAEVGALKNNLKVNPSLFKSIKGK